MGRETVLEALRDGPEKPPVVLVVEDEVLIRLATADDLRDEGFQVVEAANADEAWSYLSAHRVDALVTDVRMQGSMDGIELARRVGDRFDRIIRIVVSGHVGTEFSLPGVTILSKPYDTRLVSQLIRKGLGRKE